VLRAVHGTQPLKMGPPKRVVRVLLLTVASKKKKHRSLVTRLLKQRPGARTRAASARTNRTAIVGHALPARHQAGLGGT